MLSTPEDLAVIELANTSSEDFFLYGLCKLDNRYFIQKAICPLEINHKKAVNNVAMFAGRKYLLSSTNVQVFAWTIGLKNLNEKLELTNHTASSLEQITDQEIDTHTALILIEKYKLTPETQYPITEAEGEPSIDLLS